LKVEISTFVTAYLRISRWHRNRCHCCKN